MKIILTISLSVNIGAILAIMTNHFVHFEPMTDLMLILATATISVYTFIIYKLNHDTKN